MDKKGQLVIFVIIAILIVGGIVLFYLLSNKTINEEEIVSPTAEPIYDYVKECVKKTAEYGVYEIGAKGGYYFPPEKSLDTTEAYYTLKKENLIPNKTIIEEQLSAYVEVNLRNCINAFEPFSSFNITTDEIAAKTNLNEERFSLEVSYPIVIKKADSTFRISEFKVMIPTRANLLHEIASNYTNLFVESGGVSLTYASNVEDSFSVISTFQHFPDYILVTLTDKKGINKNSTYEWKFALA